MSGKTIRIKILDNEQCLTLKQESQKIMGNFKVSHYSKSANDDGLAVNLYFYREMEGDNESDNSHGDQE